jgi:hypothetical protein
MAHKIGKYRQKLKQHVQRMSADHLLRGAVECEPEQDDIEAGVGLGNRVLYLRTWNKPCEEEDVEGERSSNLLQNSSRYPSSRTPSPFELCAHIY